MFEYTGYVKMRREDYDVPCVQLAQELLGNFLVRKLPTGEMLRGLIVETECYEGRSDPASHSYRGQTPRNYPMFMAPGTSYVYLLYGLYFCLNISSRGEGCAVLIRAVDPVSELDIMRKNRAKLREKAIKKNATTHKTPKPLKDNELCNGPAKLCSSLKIDMSCNAKDLTESDQMWVERQENRIQFPIVSCSRIGIGNYGPEAVAKNYRFYILGNRSVSIRDRTREIETLNSRDETLY